MKKLSTYHLAILLCLSLVLVHCQEKEEQIIEPDPPTEADSKTKDDLSNARYVDNIYPDRPWDDIYDNVINAHAGGIYYENGFYHWYGEHKVPGTSERTGYTHGGIHLYRSRDLINWNDLGIVLSVDYNNPNSDLAYGCIVQRPKVVRNPRTGKYVAFFKLYLKGNGYRVCHTGVATADQARGPFTYSHKFLAASPEFGSGDFALFQTGNGDLYHFTVRKGDRAFVKARMRSDYMYPATSYTQCSGVANGTEAPAMFYKSGTYHLFGSRSDGWRPTDPRYYTSRSLDGPWVNQGNPLSGTNSVTGIGPDKTFGGQSTFINQIQGKENQYILMMDVWKPEDPITSRYIWLPFRVKNRKIEVRWTDRWNLDWFNNN